MVDSSNVNKLESHDSMDMCEVQHLIFGIRLDFGGLDVVGKMEFLD